MKHSSVLILGLTTLILSSASAYAREPLTFDPSDPSANLSVVNRSAPYTTASNTKGLPDAIEPDTIETAKLPSEQGDRLTPSERTKQSSDRSNLPLFELSPFQPDSSDRADTNLSNTNLSNTNLSDANLSQTEDFDRSQNDEVQSDSLLPNSSPVSHSDTNYSSPQASAPGASDHASPFQLPDHLTDEDLFEIHSPQNLEEDRFISDSNSSSGSSSDFKSNSRPQSDSKIESETTSDVDTFPSIEQTGSHAINSRNSDAVGLSFEPPGRPQLSPSASQSNSSPTSNSSPIPVESSISAKPDIATADDDSIDRLFKGDSDSIVAVAVGSAEGTRTPDGGKNSAYHGHTDPGNGVWNLGSFSYQHEASSPEEADAKQLARLHSQTQTILDRATAKGLALSLEEKLNGIDLANQAPKAALDKHGSYIDWLADARSSGLAGNDAILWARVHSFLNPRTQTWDAPGLGNSEERITRDQERRMLAIAKAIATYVQDIASVP